MPDASPLVMIAPSTSPESRPGPPAAPAESRHGHQPTAAPSESRPGHPAIPAARAESRPGHQPDVAPRESRLDHQLAAAPSESRPDHLLAAAPAAPTQSVPSPDCVSCTAPAVRGSSHRGRRRGARRGTRSRIVASPETVRASSSPSPESGWPISPLDPEAAEFSPLADGSPIQKLTMSDPPSHLSDISYKEVTPTPSILSETDTPGCSLEGSQSSLNAQELSGDESPSRGGPLTQPCAHPALLALLTDLKRSMEQSLNRIK